MPVRIQQDPFDIGKEVSAFLEGHTDVGALVTFSGIVRSSQANPLSGMLIEHYPGMTQKSLIAIADEASRRWQLNDYLIIHRHGHLDPGEHIMMVATLSRHRRESFAAAEFMMDYLKSRAPFWKKEFTSEGANWVSSTTIDEAAIERWGVE